jgi:hypothetical protein
MGFGMGLVMSPMSTAAMNAVDRTKAGAASGVLSMSRMVGGSVGLAVMGALVTTIGRSNLDSSLPHGPAAIRAKLASALGSGAAPSGHHASATVVDATRHAFVSALGTGLEVGTAVALIGAVVTWRLIQRVPRSPRPSAAEAGEATAESAAVEVGLA